MINTGQPLRHPGKVAVIEPGLLVALENIGGNHEVFLDSGDIDIFGTAFSKSQLAVDRNIPEIMRVVKPDSLMTQLPGPA